MSTTRGLTALALVAGTLAIAASIAPAAAGVNCSDLKTRDVAQSYFEARTRDVDGLDADADGKACENNDSGSGANWALVGLGVLLAGGLIRFATDADRQKRQRTVAVPAEVREPVPSLAVASDEQSSKEDDAMPAPIDTRSVVAMASVGSLGELARALRLVPYAQRMAVLEKHAEAHGSSPRDVLDALAEHTSDLELQGWALAGYDPPWFVRPMYCDCVGGLRNYRLRTAEDGSHYWACASCQSRDRRLS